jgi:MFS family permease
MKTRLARSLLWLCGLAIWWPTFHRLIHRPLDSDAFYLAALYKDLAIDHVSLKGWNLTQVRALFPDAPLFFAWQALVGSSGVGSAGDVGYVFAGFAATVLGLLGWALSRLSRQPLAGPLFVLLSGLAVLGAPYYVPWFVLPGFHAGTLLAGVAMLWLARVERPLELPSRARLAALILVVALAAFSDALILAQFVAPWLLVRAGQACAEARRRRGGGHGGALGVWRAAWPVPLALALGLGVVGSALLERALREGGVFRFAPGFDLSPLALLRHGPNWGRWLASLRALGVILRTTPALTFMLILGYGVLARTARRAALSRFALIQALVCLCAPGMMGIWEDAHGFRYMYPLALAPLAALAWALARTTLPWRALLPASALAALASLVFAGPLSLRAPETALSLCVERLQAERGVRLGAAIYWDARQTTFLNRAGVRLLDYYPDLTPSARFNNSGDYRDARLDFIVAPGIDPGVTARRLGPPRQIVRCGERSIWVYR